MKPKFLFDKDKWFLGEHIPDCDIFFFQVPATCFNNDKSYDFIRNYKKFLGFYNKFVLNFYVGEKDSFEVAESILNALLERPGFGKDLDKNIIIWSRKLIDSSRKISKLPLHDFSNKQLWDQYEENDKVHTKLYTYGWLPVAVDLFHNNFTNKLKGYLYSISDSKTEAEQAFVTLTTPWKKTIVAEEQENYLEIYEKFKADLKNKKIAGELKNKIKKHAEKWGHLGYIYAGNVEPFGEKHYLKELMELADTGVDGRKILFKEKHRLKEVRQKQQSLYKKLKISPLYRRLFESAQNFALSKLVRRHAQLLNAFLLHKTLLTEIAKRLRLNRYQVQFMLKGEVKNGLLKNRVDRSLLLKRLRHCVFYSEKDFEKIYSGQMEKRLWSQIRMKIDKNITELKGQTAQPGLAKGLVKIIFRAKDMAKMNQGDILVSVATDPDIVPAMKKAAAIITEQGGITSHAAIVSRELGIPCIIGTKIATKVLKDGDMVEVDADRGIIKILK